MPLRNLKSRRLRSVFRLVVATNDLEFVYNILFVYQSINQSMLVIPEYSIHIQIMLSHSYAIKKNKQTSMHVHIAYASNAGAMGKCIYDHCQQCSVGLNCMTSL